MKTKTFNSWTQIPPNIMQGIQVKNFFDSKTAFKYAEKEYAPYGYKNAIWSSDIKTLFIVK